jgi:multicomponent Na+:H+ antiporter subunit D
MRRPAAVSLICGVLLYQAQKGTIVYWFGGWTPHRGIALGISFTIDPLGAGMATLAAVLVTASFVFTWHYFDAVDGLFHALMLIFLGAMAGYCLTGDIFNLFVLFELMGGAAYALTGYKIEETGPLQDTLNFAITNTSGAFWILIGIALLYGRTGALNLAQIGQTLARGPADGLVIMAFVLITCGQGGDRAAALLDRRCARGGAVAGLRALLRRDGGTGPVRRGPRLLDGVRGAARRA